MVKRPLAIFGLSYFFALLAASYLPLACLLAPAAVFGLLLIIYKLKGKGVLYFVLVLAGIAYACASHLGSEYFLIRPVQERIGESGTAVVTVLETEPGYRDGMAAAVLYLESWNGQEAGFKAFCAEFPALEPGERASAKLILREPDVQEKLTLYADTVFVSAEYSGGLKILTESQRLSMRLLRLRNHFSLLLRRHLSEDTGGVAAAMILGDKTKLSEDLRRTMRKAGLSHLLVVSGLHLSMVCALLWQRKNGRSRHYRLRAAASILLALMVAAITGFTPSVSRAAVAAVITYTGMAFLLPEDGLTSMAAAALLLCFRNAYTACDLGLQLSFAATMGLTWWDLIDENIRFWWHCVRKEPKLMKRKDRIQEFMVLRLPSTVCAPFFAGLAVSPVLLVNGFAVSGVSLLTNILTVGLVPYILVLGYLVIFTGTFAPLHFIYRGCGVLLQLALRLLLAIAGFFGELPLARLPLPSGYSYLVLGTLAALVWLAWYRGRYRWLLAAIPVCVAVSAVLGIALQRDTVEIAIVGNRAYPCVVVSENGECCAVFRGGAANQYAIEHYLDRKSLDEVNYSIDIRTEKGNVSLPAGKTLRVREHSGEEIAVLPHVSASLFSQPEGNLVILEVDGWQLAVSSGKLALTENTRVDAFAVGGALPDMPLAEVYLTRSRRLESKGNSVYRGENTPGVELRPGKSVRYKGGEWLAE